MKSCVIPLLCRKWSVGHPQQAAQLPGKCGKVGWMHLTQRVGMGTCRSYFALNSEGESICGAEMPQRIHSTAGVCSARVVTLPPPGSFISQLFFGCPYSVTLALCFIAGDFLLCCPVLSMPLAK